MRTSQHTDWLSAWASSTARHPWPIENGSTGLTINWGPPYVPKLPGRSPGPSLPRLRGTLSAQGFPDLRVVK